MPDGRTHTSPRVTEEAPWPSRQARNLAVAAGYDCHRDETEWPFYATVATMSWLIARDVDDGRESLNFSTWGESDADAGDAADELAEGSMPPARDLPLHPDARLSNEEKAALVAALTSMDDGEDHSGRGRGGDDHRGSDERGGEDEEGADHSGPG